MCLVFKGKLVNTPSGNKLCPDNIFLSEVSSVFSACHNCLWKIRKHLNMSIMAGDSRPGIWGASGTGNVWVQECLVVLVRNFGCYCTKGITTKTRLVVGLFSSLVLWWLVIPFYTKLIVFEREYVIRNQWLLWCWSLCSVFFHSGLEIWAVIRVTKRHDCQPQAMRNHESEIFSFMALNYKTRLKFMTGK